MSKKDTFTHYEDFDFAIITINDPANYGNRLQNYALTRMLLAYGSTVTIYHRFEIWKRKIGHVVRVIRSIYDDGAKLELIRRKRIADFTSKHIGNLPICVTVKRGMVPNNVPVKQYVLGSDQIWNYRSVPSTQDLLIRFSAFDNRKSAISYAASFGVAEIPAQYDGIYREGISHVRSISVREFAGASIVQDIANRQATVVLDPTLMLSAENWLGITEGFVSNDDKYVLTYFLGQPSVNQEYDIQTYAKAHGCRVRRMLDLRDKETYIAGPQDFVELFAKADYVFTDSYHACCFSIIFHKQFTVYNRAGMAGKSNMNSRMETLFRLFNLQSVMMDSGLAPAIDYEKVDSLLAQHRKKSYAWLDEAIEGIAR